ncbi:MAG: retention module-containing protein, partial [Desulfobacteraceae bacterium]|nr:retention module-containing protein [Desulfobacteraceae bacterium]
MAQAGIIQTISGSIIARTPQGDVRELKIGDVVYENEFIEAANGSHATISDMNGNLINLAENSKVLLDETVTGKVDAYDAVIHEVDNLQNALVEGEDISDAEQETAIGEEEEVHDYNPGYHEGDNSAGEVGSYLIDGNRNSEDRTYDPPIINNPDTDTTLVATPEAILTLDTNIPPDNTMHAAEAGHEIAITDTVPVTPTEEYTADTIPVVIDAPPTTDEDQPLDADSDDTVPGAMDDPPTADEEQPLVMDSDDTVPDAMDDSPTPEEDQPLDTDSDDTVPGAMDDPPTADEEQPLDTDSDDSVPGAMDDPPTPEEEHPMDTDSDDSVPAEKDDPPPPEEEQPMDTDSDDSVPGTMDDSPTPEEDQPLDTDSDDSVPGAMDDPPTADEEQPLNTDSDDSFPVAMDDSPTTEEEQSVDIDVLANDTLADDATMTDFDTASEHGGAIT